MNKSQLLAIMLGVCWTVAPCLQSTLSAQPPEKETTKQEIRKEAGQTQPLAGKERAEEQEKDKFADHPKHIRTNYYCILRNIQEANKDYVARGRKITSSLEESIKKHGIGKIVGIRNNAHHSCLDLALERIAHKMAGKEYDKKTQQISQQYYGNIQKTNVSAPIDFEREIIIQACQKKMSLDVLFYERLLTSKLKTKKEERDYKELVQSAFSEKEYLDVISKRLSAIDGIYDTFVKSRVGFRGLFATGGINEMRMFAIQYYKGEAEKIYPAKANRKVLKKMEGKNKAY